MHISQCNAGSHTPSSGSILVIFVQVPFSDWALKAEDIEICKRPSGDDWQIGAGAFGQVRTLNKMLH